MRSPRACSAGCATGLAAARRRSATARSRSSRRGSRRSGRASPRPASRASRSPTAQTAGTETGAVVANEVLDALPVHRVVGRPDRPDGIAELLVGLDAAGAFAWTEASPRTPDLAARLRAEDVTLADGQVTEVCLALDGWLAGATRHLGRGVVVLVDYADEPAALHHPLNRPTGTLRGFARHAVGGDPFRHVGRQDLTATVDLAAVRAAAARAGLEPVGETTQGELHRDARDGRPDDGDPPPRRAPTSRTRSTSGAPLARLLDPRGMGGFRVLVFGRGLPAGTELAGLDGSIAPGDERPGPAVPSGPCAGDRC